MTNILTIDPGVHQYGWAWWTPERGEEPFGCGFSDTLATPGPWYTGFEIIVEKPQWRGPRTPRPQDLLDLSLAAGILGGPRATYVPVSQWKGNRSKEAMHTHLYQILSESELQVIESLDVPRAKLHNVLDAVCLLMWRLGRMKR